MTKEEFYGRINDAARDVLQRVLAADGLKIRPQVVKQGQDVEPPFEITLPLTREESYVQRLFLITTEVLDSFNAMRSAETYLSRFAFAEEGIAASVYIRYHVANFLNEMYILRERIDTFAVKLEREFRKDTRLKNREERIAYARSEIKRIFGPATEMRGAHVHRARHDDAELAQLALWEMLAEHDPAQFAARRDACADLARCSNLKFVQNVNAGLNDRLDQTFSFFEGLVFRPDGSLRYPPNICAVNLT